MLPCIPLFFFHNYHVSWQHFKIASTLGIKKCILNIIQIMVLLYHSIGYMSRKILITKLTSLVFRLTILKHRLKILLCWLFNLLDQHTFCQDQWWVKPYAWQKKKPRVEDLVQKIQNLSYHDSARLAWMYDFYELFWPK